LNASPDDALTVRIAGEPVALLGQRALYWPARKRLVIADLHLGKGDVFRRAGIAVPQGATRADLLRLSRLVATTGACELWIVGDVLHGPMSQAGWKDAWIRWRAEHAALDVAVLAGNHDRALQGDELGLRMLGETWAEGPFLFRHIPAVGPLGRHVIAGHVHPKVRVPGLPRHWPAFWLKPEMTVLPAFSEFTGGHVIRAGQNDGAVACVKGTVLSLRSG